MSSWRRCSALPPVQREHADEVYRDVGWETPLDAMEAGGPSTPEAQKNRRAALGRRALVGAGGTVIALVGVALLSIGIGGRSGFVLDAVGSVATGAWGVLTGRVEAVDSLSGSEGPQEIGSGLVAEAAPTADGIVGRPAAPSALEVLAGDRQLGLPGTQLPVELQVRVTDESGEGLSGVPVVFEVMSGGGSSFPEEVLTGPDGIGSARWTLGEEGEDGQMLIAWTEGIEDEGAVFLSFLEGSTAGGPLAAEAEVVSGGTQVGTAGEETPEPLSLRVVDEEGAPLEGILVQFLVETGSGQVSPSAAITNGAGEAMSTWRLGPAAGGQAVVAEIDEVPELRVRFEASAEAAGLSAAAAVATGGTFSCSLGGDGRLACWGGNADGQLGDGSSGGTLVPDVPLQDVQFARVASGLGHVCALNLQGEAYCWGSNGQGQLGTGSPTSAREATQVSGSITFSALAAGVSHTCALESSGSAYCWGSNGDGQLGNGSAQSRDEPTPVSVNTAFVQISAGWRHTCALDRQGQAYCWGANASGQLGSGPDAGGSSPTQVAGGHRFRTLAAGNAHTCGLAVDERILCWGANGSGQLGDGTTQDRSDPQPVATTAGFASVTAGGVHTCGLTVDGGAMCWGTNVYGQVGDGTTQSRSTPVPVAGFDRFSRISAFGSHTCGRSLSGAIRCWGYNVEGQLGDGTRENRLAPTAVAASVPG